MLGTNFSHYRAASNIATIILIIVVWGTLRARDPIGITIVYGAGPLILATILSFFEPKRVAVYPSLNRVIRVIQLAAYLWGIYLGNSIVQMANNVSDHAIGGLLLVTLCILQMLNPPKLLYSSTTQQPDQQERRTIPNKTRHW